MSKRETVVFCWIWKYAEKHALNKGKPPAQLRFYLSLESSSTPSHTGDLHLHTWYLDLLKNRGGPHHSDVGHTNQDVWKKSVCQVGKSWVSQNICEVPKLHPVWERSKDGPGQGGHHPLPSTNKSNKGDAMFPGVQGPLQTFHQMV